MNFIYERTTLNWEQITETNYVKEARKHPIPGFPQQIGSPEAFLDKIKLWNSCLPINYFAFRSRLKTIHNSSMSSIPSKDIVTAATVHRLAKLDKFILLPIDDDDWFSPEIFEVLNKEKRPWDIAVWPSFWVGVPGETGIFHGGTMEADVSKAGFKLWSNNYAISKTGFLKCHHTGLLEYHWAGNDCCLRTKIINFGERMSVCLKSPASITSMYHWQNRRDVMSTVQFKIPGKLPRSMSWADPYYEQFYQLMQRLNKKIPLL